MIYLYQDLSIIMLYANLNYNIAANIKYRCDFSHITMSKNLFIVISSSLSIYKNSITYQCFFYKPKFLPLKLQSSK